jgi:hypothetical protein
MVEFGASNQGETPELSSNKEDRAQDPVLPNAWRQLCDQSLSESILDAPAARYLNQTAVRELGLKVARETFRNFPIDRYIPERDTLLTVAIDHNLFSRVIGVNRSICLEAIAAGEPIIVQSPIEIRSIDELGLLPHGSFKEQLAWISAQVRTPKTRAFNAADLLLGLPIETKEGVLLNIPFESSITGSTPWAYAAHEAYQKVLSIALAAAVLETVVAPPFKGETALELFLKHGLRTIQDNPCAILQEPLVKRAQHVTALPRAELLVEMSERAAVQALQRENWLKTFTRTIDEQQIKLEKRLAKQEALVALGEKLRQQAAMPNDIFDTMLEDLLDALSVNAAYRQNAPEDISSIALDLVKDLIEVKDIETRLDIACQWSRLIRSGMKKAQLPKRSK